MQTKLDLALKLKTKRRKDANDFVCLIKSDKLVQFRKVWNSDEISDLRPLIGGRRAAGRAVAHVLAPRIASPLRACSQLTYRTRQPTYKTS